MEDPRETLFDGPALEPPEAASGFGWLIRFDGDGDGDGDVPPPPPPVEVRHALGYGPFVERVEALGGDPAALAGDLPALLAFAAAHPEVLDDPVAARAAGTFLGNALIVAHPAAVWRRGREREVGTDTRSITVDRALQHVVEEPDRAPELVTMLAEWTAADAQHALVEEAMTAAMEHGAAPALVEPPRPFIRPEVPPRTFLDDAGAPIPYGERWDDPTPDDAYSRVTHPERFAPVHEVADSLVRYLADAYETTVTEERNADGERVVRLVPRRGAAVTVRFSGFPGVEIRAGAFFTAAVPHCGCDACDETAESAVDEVEDALLAIAAGGLTERYPVGPRDDHVVGLRTAEGASGSSGQPDAAPSAEMRAALAALPDGRWPAWPLRGHDDGA